MGYAGKHWGSNYKHWETLGQHWGTIGMKELGHCAGITSTAWVTRARAIRTTGRDGGTLGNNGGDWQTTNWSKIRRITKAKAGEHFQLLFIL